MYMVIKMLEEKRNFNTRNDGEIVSLDDLVPKFHLLRKIDKSIDWRKIYPIVEGKYTKKQTKSTVTSKKYYCFIKYVYII